MQPLEHHPTVPQGHPPGRPRPTRPKGSNVHIRTFEYDYWFFKSNKQVQLQPFLSGTLSIVFYQDQPISNNLGAL